MISVLLVITITFAVFAVLFCVYYLIKRRCLTAYKYDSDGYFEGIIRNCEILPYNTTREAPPLTFGYIPRWDGNKWDLIENHKGEKGYVNGVLFLIREYGPYPEGWSKDGSINNKKIKRKKEVDEIKQRLVEIDYESIRPLRALINGTGIQEDRDKLKKLNEEASNLRDKLMILV